MEHSEKYTEVAKALLKAQAAIGGLVKKDAKNLHFKSDYASLEAVINKTHPVLIDCKILTMQEVVGVDEGIDVITTFMHETGEWIRSAPFRVPVAKKDAQGYGSGVTYGRRYSLMALLGLAPADDDGNAATSDAKPSVNERIKETPAPATPENDEMTAPQKRKFFAMCNEAKLSPEDQEKFRSWLKEKCFKQDPISKKNASVLIETFAAKLSEWRSANGEKTYEEKLEILTEGFERGESLVIDALKAGGW